MTFRALIITLLFCGLSLGNVGCSKLRSKDKSSCPHHCSSSDSECARHYHKKHHGAHEGKAGECPHKERCECGAKKGECSYHKKGHKKGHGGEHHHHGKHKECHKGHEKGDKKAHKECGHHADKSAHKCSHHKHGHEKHEHKDK